MLSAATLQQQFDTHLDPKDMQKVIATLSDILKQDPALAEKAHSAFKPLFAAHKKTRRHDDSPLSTTLKRVTNQRLSKLLIDPVMALSTFATACSFFSPVKANPTNTNFTVVNSHGNGPNVCGSAYWCIQAAIKQGYMTKAVVDRIIKYQQLTPDFGIQIALDECFDRGDLRGILSDMIDKIPNWMHEGNENQIVGPTWHPSKHVDTYFMMETNGVSTDGVQHLQSSLNKMAEHCQRYATSAKAGGIDFGFALVGIVGLIICAAACIGGFLGIVRLKEKFEDCSMPSLPCPCGDNDQTENTNEMRERNRGRLDYMP